MSEPAASYQVGGDHYTRMSVQPWAAMQAWMTPEEFRGFLRGNALKYLARAGTKGSSAGATAGKQREDYAKARHYLDRLIATYEGDWTAAP
jgi:hypothetical protein